MCTIFSPAIGNFLFIDSSFNQVPAGWSVEFNAITNPTQINFLYNNVVRASVSTQGNQNFETGWPRWSPAGNFVAVAYVEINGEYRKHWVQVIDIRDPSNVPQHIIYGGEATSNNAPSSFTEMRATSDGEAFMCLTNLTGTASKAHVVYRTFGTFNGNILCSFGETSEPAMKNARITNDEVVQIFLEYQSGSEQVLRSCDLPRGALTCGSQPLSFPPVIIGGPVTNTLESITLFNTGTDCIEINSIADSGPFSVDSIFHSLQNQVVTLPVSVAVGGSLEITIQFSPTAEDDFEEELLITSNPARGCDRIVCRGFGILGVGVLAANLPDFDSVPVGESRQRSLGIRNTGNIEVDVQVAERLTGNFTWPALAQTTLQPNAETNLDVTFTPITAGLITAVIPANSTNAANAVGGVVFFNVQGDACSPQATLSVNRQPLPFGSIERGFRVVRMFSINVAGNTAIDYFVRIENDAEGLYGIQAIGASSVNAPALLNDTIRPPVICGNGEAGTGEHLLAVVFWANGEGTEAKTADLVVGYASPQLEVSRSPLEAVIIDTVAIDAALVLDRSLSMDDFTTDMPAQPGGDRRKVDACVAAAHLFVDLLRPEVADRISVVRFNEQPDVLQEMTLLAETEDGTNPSREQVKGTVSNNTASLEPNGATGIAGGVLIGIDEMLGVRSEPLPDVRKILMVLTDGKGNRAFQRNGVWYTVQGGSSYTPGGDLLSETEAVQIPVGIQVHAVGIGAEEDIDRGQLAQLSEETGGIFYVVNDLSGQQYFELEKLFFQTFLGVIDWESISDPVFNIPVGAQYEHSFNLLKGDFGGMVVLFHHYEEPIFELLSPANELFSLEQIPTGFAVRTGQSSTARYIEFRCPPGEPERYAGLWKIIVRHPGVTAKGAVRYGFAIGAGSNFRMSPFLTPGLLKIGDVIELSALITEVNLPVSGCDVMVTARSPSGQTWELELLETSPGEYAATFLHVAEGGSYRFLFRATGLSRDGEPVQREAVRSKYVQGRVPIVNPRPGDDDCCSYLLKILPRLYRVVVVIALLVLLLLFLMFV